MDKFKAEAGTVPKTLMMSLYGRIYCAEFSQHLSQPGSPGNILFAAQRTAGRRSRSSQAGGAALGLASPRAARPASSSGARWAETSSPQAASALTIMARTDSLDSPRRAWP